MIEIKHDPTCDMMEIVDTNIDEDIFLGNIWDFHRDPAALCQFLRDCGVDAKVTLFVYMN